MFAYAMHLRFKNTKLHSKNVLLEKIMRSSLRILSLLEIYNEQRTYGIAVWESKKTK